MFCPLSRYVRTDSCFWDFSWELRGTGLTSSLTACPHPSGVIRGQLIVPISTTLPKCWLVQPACSWSEREMMWFLTSPPCMFPCVLHRDSMSIFSSTSLQKIEWMQMTLFQIERMDYIVPRLFAAAGHLHFSPLNSTVSPEVLTVRYCIQLFITTVPSQTTEVSVKTRTFSSFHGILIFPSNIFPRFSFRSLNRPDAVLRKQHDNL